MFLEKPFHKLQSLQNLNLNVKDNELESLPDNSFHDIQLERLSMPNNKIKTITMRTFHGLRKLRILDMQINLLSNISYHTFDY